MTYSFLPHYGPRVEPALLGRKGGWCVILTTLPPSCADCFEIWKPLPPGTLWGFPDLYLYLSLLLTNYEVPHYINSYHFSDFLCSNALVSKPFISINLMKH